MTDHVGSAGSAKAARTVLLALALQQLLMAYDSTAMNVALSTIVADLGTTLTGVQAAIALYSLVMAAFMITGSKLGLRHGHLRMFTLGTVLYGAGAVVTALSPGLPVMVLGWSLLEGLGAALVFPAVMSIATVLFEGAARTKALALVATMVGVGGALGPLLGGLITSVLTWRASFLMEAAVTLVVIFMVRGAREPAAPGVHRPFDGVGVVLSAVGCALVVLATLLAGRFGLFTSREDVVLFGRVVIAAGDLSLTVVLVAVGVAVLAAFGWWEMRLVARGEDPLVRVAVLRDRTTSTGSAALAVQFLVTAGTMFLIPVFLQTTLSYGALASGVTQLPSTVALVAAATAASKLAGSGRIGRKALVVAGFGLVVVGLVIIALTMRPHSTGWSLLPGLAVLGLGLGACVVLTDLVQSSAPPGQVSDVAGLSRSSSYLGQSVGVALSGAVLLGALLGSFTAGVNTSTALSATQKDELTTAVRQSSQTAAVSDDQARSTLARAGVTGATEEEIVRLNGQARITGLRASVLVMAGFALVGVVLALAIPVRPRRTPGVVGGAVPPPA
ncbi:MAG: MFS transporter [Saccharothrix sp.]|nr:MFS transporter [Saccharothrix sp.]